MCYLFLCSLMFDLLIVSLFLGAGLGLTLITHFVRLIVGFYTCCLLGCCILIGFGFWLLNASAC